MHVKRVPVSADAHDPPSGASQRGAPSGAARPAEKGPPRDAAQPAEQRPPCAGIGLESGIVWTCWDCLVDISARKPKMPIGQFLFFKREVTSNAIPDILKFLKGKKVQNDKVFKKLTGV